MTDMDRETLTELLRPIEPSDVIDAVTQTAAERAEVLLRIEHMKQHRGANKAGFDALYAHLDTLDPTA